MRTLTISFAVAVLAGAPASALASGWAAARIHPLVFQVDPLEFAVIEQQTRVQVIESEGSRAFAMPGDVLFAYDSARVTAAGERTLRSVAERAEGRAVEVVGHTDARGSAAYNDRLSERRAEAAARVLADAGLDVSPRGAGENEPVASNRRAAGRARNRRVEVVVPRG